MASPSKRRPTTTGGKSRNNQADELMNTLQSENQSLEFQLGERDIEMERMKTTLIALNEKLALTNDIKLNCE